MGDLGLVRVILILVLMSGCPIEATQFTPLPPSIPELKLPRNDSYQGSVITQSLQPTFVWHASGEVGDPISYELQYSSDENFVDDLVTEKVQETQYQPPSSLPVSMSAPVGRRYYWRVRACLPLICSEYSSKRWVNLGRDINDYNGDGYADIAIGAPFAANFGRAFMANIKSGRVSLYAGSQTLSPVAKLELVGKEISNKLGFGGSAGDVNGDGHSDLLIGEDVTGSAGGVHIHLGSAGSLPSLTEAALLQGFSGDNFGKTVASIGDANGDGFDDIAVGGGGPGGGRVYIFFGNAAEPYDDVPHGILEGPADSGFGQAITSSQ